MKAFKAFISGRVQGVMFRYTAQERAEGLDIGGWVRNTADGRVEVFAQGRDEDLQVFAAWLEDGPAGADVTGVHLVDALPDPRFARFEIRL
jgi:acylphosphatase